MVASSEEATCLAVSRGDFQKLTTVTKEQAPKATFTETEEDEMMMAAITDDDELMAIAGDLSAAPAGAAGLPMQLA